MAAASSTGRVALGQAGPARPSPTPLLRARGAEWSPAWSPDGTRIAYGATADGAGSIRVVDAELPPEPGTVAPRPSGAAPALPVVVSRHAGQVAWSPDGRTLLVTDLADRDDGYNGQPHRGVGVSAPSFPSAMDRGARFIPAPSPADAVVRPLQATAAATPARRVAVFDGVWEALARLYYAGEPAASAWRERCAIAIARGRRRPGTTVRSRTSSTRWSPTSRSCARQSRARAASWSRRIRSRPRRGPPCSAPAATPSTRRSRSRSRSASSSPTRPGIGGDGMALVLARRRRRADRRRLQGPGLRQRPRSTARQSSATVGCRTHGPVAMNIPGVVAGLEHLHRRFGSGRAAWADLVAPAIRFADEGFVLDEALPATIGEAQATIARYDATRAIYMPNGRLPRAGDRFVNRDYASTLRAIAADGADAFYRGSIARRMVDDIASHGGVLSLDDLEQYRPLEREAVRGRYRGHVVFSTPPPVASGTALVELLQTLDRQPLAPGTRVARDVEAAHLLIETFKQAHPIRAADPALWPDESGVHLTAAHAAEVFSQIDAARASRGRAAADEAEDDGGAGAGAGADAVGGAGADAPEPRLGRGTSALVVADRAGNLVVVTQTLSTWGGSFYVSRGLGFLYNNHLRMARTRRGAAGQLTPRARSSTANASTIVCREVDGRLVPRLAAGAAGSAWIVPSVVAVVSAVVDGGLPAQAAVEAPRFRVDDAGRVQMEDRFPRPLVRELARRGHVLTRIGGKGELRYGFVSAIAIDPATGHRSAGADPRRSHAAVAVP